MLKIFIVDDNRPFSETLASILSAAYPSAVISTFADGGRIVDRVQSESPDLVFMDINLPHTDGLTLTRQIKKVTDRVPVIVVTSYDDAEYRSFAMKAGADRFLQKDDITIEAFLKMIRSVINGTDGSQPHHQNAR